jgi:hypothetical protein
MITGLFQIYENRHCENWFEFVIKILIPCPGAYIYSKNVKTGTFGIYSVEKGSGGYQKR